MLHCIALALQLCCLYEVPPLPYSIFPPTFNNYTGSQSVSSVLLWQPSNCIDLFVIDYSLLFLENKYDDDDDDDDTDVICMALPQNTSFYDHGYYGTRDQGRIKYLEELRQSLWAWRGRGAPVVQPGCKV